MVSHAATVVEWALRNATDDPVRTLRTAEASQTCGTPSEGNEFDHEQARDAEHGQSEGVGLKRELMSEILDLGIIAHIILPCRRQTWGTQLVNSR